jgi:hypothetical protein
MFALSDSQLRTIWNAAGGLPAEKRGVYLERINLRAASLHSGHAADLQRSPRMQPSSL